MPLYSKNQGDLKLCISSTNDLYKILSIIKLISLKTYSYLKFLSFIQSFPAVRNFFRHFY